MYKSENLKVYKILTAFLDLLINRFFPIFLIIFFTYIKVSKDLSGKYFQVNKKRLQKTAHERYPFENEKKWKKKMKKSGNIIVNDTKIYQNMKNKSWLIIEKILQNETKCFAIIIRNFCLENSFFSDKRGVVLVDWAMWVTQASIKNIFVRN